MKNNQKVGAIIAAAGESRRMGGSDKVLLPLGGKSVLWRVIDVFQECRLIDQIVAVVNERSMESCRQLVDGGGWDKVSDKVSDVCLGGRRRQDSVAVGLKRLKDCDWVVIHDGARPLVTVDLIERGLEAARETCAAAAAVPVTDTIKVVGDAEMVRETPLRQNLRAVQTPQVFCLDIIKKAYQKANGDVTDDASLVEQAGYKVKLYPGSYDNIKITTPEDLALAEILWKKYER